MSYHSVRRFINNRPRLTTASIAGVSIAILLPESWPVLTRLLTGWNIAVWSYLILMAWLMLRASHARVRKIALQEDENAALILAVMSIGAILSLAAISIELATVKDIPAALRIGRYSFTFATVVGSWFLLGTVFTFHYAHMFYRCGPENQPLQFPCGETNPDYWDFLYFSFTIAVAAQTSDVCVHSRAMRKVVLAQSVLSFFFNVAIIGLSINIAASLVGT
jgi:uncharacterized membrane protein